MKQHITIILAWLSCALVFAQNQAPTVQITDFNVDFSQEKLTFMVDVQDAENDPVNLHFLFEELGNEGFTTFSPDSLSAAQPLNNGLYRVVWQYGGEVADITETTLKVVTNDGQHPTPCQLAAQVDSNRLKQTLLWLQGQRNYSVNAPLMEEIKDSLAQIFTQSGLTTNKINFNSSVSNSQNIVGVKQGLHQSNNYILIDAHFDAVSNSPGADDNASGVAGVLEALHILKNQTFAHNLEFVAFDLEELGLLGSKDYVNNIPAQKEVLGVFNFEMIGYYSNQPNTQSLPTGFSSLFPTQTAAIVADNNRGNFITNVYNAGSAGLGGEFAQAASSCVPQLKVISLEVPGNGAIAPDLRRSDHAPFWDKNIPALMITDGANFRNLNYHTPNDTMNTLNFTFMQQVVSTVVAAAYTMVNPLHGTATTLNLSFVDVGHHHHEDEFFNISPNPANNQLSVALNNQYPKVLIEIYDLQGKKVFQEIKPGDRLVYTLDISKLSQGQYVISMANGHQQTTKMFVKQ